MEILWKGNIISCVKSIGKRNCELCMKEKMEILNKWETNPNTLINSRSEIFGGCRHKPKFHRYLIRPHGQAGTDDGVTPERVEFGYNGKYPNWWTENIHENGILSVRLSKGTSQPTQEMSLTSDITCVSLFSESYPSGY